MRELASRIKTLAPSATMAVIEAAARLRAEGADVISFGAGEPDFDTPNAIIEKAYEGMRAGHTRYTPGRGSADLRKAVCERMARRNDLHYEPDQIVVSNGGKHSLFNSMMILFQAGDEVIIPSPYWVTYPEVVKLSGATPVFLETKDTDGFQINRDMLESVVTEKTAGIILNTPSNPSGAVLNHDSMAAVAAFAEAHDLWIVSDECYESLVYEGSHISMATLPGAYDRTITLQTMSKTFAMTGWRMGFAAAPAKQAKAMGMYQGQATGCAGSITQYASAAALRGDESFLDEWRSAYRSRRDLMVAELNRIPEVTCATPAGAFYTFPNISAYFGKKAGEWEVNNGADMARYLIESAYLAVVPGSAFGAEGFIRLSYATSLENVERGMARMRKAFEALA